MKWFIMILLFVGGIFYLYKNPPGSYGRTDYSHARVESYKFVKDMSEEEKRAALDPVLPDRPEQSAVPALSQQTVATLRGLVSKDSNEDVRLAAAETLWELQDEQAASLLKRFFKNSYSASTKGKILEMVKQEKSKVALDVLKVGLSDYDKEVKKKAIEAIRDMGTVDAEQALNPMLKDFDKDVRLCAVNAMRELQAKIKEYQEQKAAELDKLAGEDAKRRKHAIGI